MQIASIFINGFKCFKHATFSPKQLNLLFALNGSGKTAFLEAIELALTGQINDPENIGKSIDLVECFNEAYSETIVVKIVFDNGLKIDRRFTMTEKGVTQSLLVMPNPVGTKKIAELQAIINNELGGLLNFKMKEFFGLSAAKQFDEIFRIIRTEIPIDEIIDALTREYSEADRANEYFEPLKNMLLTDPISDVEAQLTRDFKDLNAAIKNAKGAVVELSQIIAQKETVGAELEALGSDYDELQEKYATLKEKTETSSIVIKERDRALNELDQLDQKIEEHNKKASDFMSSHKDLLDQTVDTVKDELADLKEVFQQTYMWVTEKNHPEPGELSALKKQKQSSVLFQFFESAKSGSCYACGETTTLEKLNKAIASECSAIDDKIAKLEARVEEIEKAKAGAREAQLKIAELSAKIGDIEDAQSTFTTLTGKHHEQLVERNKIQTRINEYNEKLEGLEDIDSNRILLDSMAENLKKKFAVIQQKNQEQGLLIAQQETIIKNRENAARFEMVKHFQSKLKELKANYISQQFGQLESEINSVYSALNGDDSRVMIRAKDNRGNDRFQIGIQKTEGLSTAFVPYRVLNRSHRLKLWLSFLFALPQEGFRVFNLDDLEVIDPVQFDRFVEGIINLDYSENDQVFLASSRNHTEKVDSAEWKLGLK